MAQDQAAGWVRERMSGQGGDLAPKPFLELQPPVRPETKDEGWAVAGAGLASQSQEQSSNSTTSRIQDNS